MASFMLIVIVILVDGHLVACQQQQQRFSIEPYKLEDMFNITVYQLNVNASSPCNYTSHNDRLLYCHQAFIFDEDAYNKKIAEFRKIILNRLGISKISSAQAAAAANKLSENRSRFLNGLEKRFGEAKSLSRVKQTSFDKSEMKNKIVKYMQTAQDIKVCAGEKATICMNFSTTAVNLYKEKAENSDSYKYERIYSSVYLWLYFTIHHSKKATPVLTITNQRLDKSVDAEVKNGWNLVNISTLVKPDNDVKFLNESLFEAIAIYCKKDCVIQIESKEDTDNATTTTAATKTNKKPSVVYLNKSSSEVPLLLINSESSASTPIASINQKRENRQKRNDDDIDFLRYSCKSPLTLNRECCLVQYYVEFETIFKNLAGFIKKPLGFLANYCFGACSKTHHRTETFIHSQIKQRYNDFKGNILPTCCHPTKMKSLTITYINHEGEEITTTIPNMITSACGCS